MLTISRIEKAKAPAEGRIVLWDNDPSGLGLPGLGCRVFPSGQRSFIVQYRLSGSRQKQTATIGAYGPITLPQARKKAQEILAKARLGSDPHADRKARAEAEGRLTVHQLVPRHADALKAGTASSKRLRAGRRARATSRTLSTIWNCSPTFMVVGPPPA